MPPGGLALIWLFLCALDATGATDAETLTVRSGDDAPLQCRGPRNASIGLVQWSRPDLHTKKYVFFYRDQHEYQNYQDPSFHGRVKLRDPEMKDGNVSVVLKNATANDTGTYECRVAADGGRRRLTRRHPPEPASVIKLIVTEPGPPDGGLNVGHIVAVVVGVVVVVVLVLVVVVGRIFKNRNSYQQPADETTMQPFSADEST